MNELVQRLSEGDHPVRIGRPEDTIEELKRRILEMGYIHIKFTATQGGTELGVTVDPEATDVSKVDWEEGSGMAHIVGGLILNYVRVRCVADIDMASREGKGHLDIIEEVSP
jgi:hypothetical protein